MKKIEYKAGNESQISLEIYEYLDLAIVDARIDGKKQVMCTPAMFDAPKKMGDKILVGHIGNIGLTQDRYDELKAAMDVLQIEIDSRPEVQLKKLISKRESLAANIGYILDAAHEDHVNRVEKMSENGFASASKIDWPAKEKAAREELAAFDEAHPEVAAKMEADKGERINNFLSRD